MRRTDMQFSKTNKFFKELPISTDTANLDLSVVCLFIFVFFALKEVSPM